MTSLGVSGLCGVICTAVLLAPASFADIKTFNAAVKAGDYKAAAIEAKAIWLGFDKSSADTAIVAREFGFASYVAGDYAAAREFGQFLKDRGASLPTPDDQPTTSTVLLAAAEFRLDANKDSRKRLFDALTARAVLTGVDNVSVLASEALYRSDWAAANWPNAVSSASLAAQLMKRGGAQLALRSMEARATSAAAGFLGGPDKDDYNNLADAHDAVIEAIDSAEDSKKRAALVPLKFQLEAWTISAANYFESAQQTGSNIPKNVRWRELRVAKEPLFSETVNENRCKGMMDVEGLRYPMAAAYKGMVGTIIMKFDYDSEGRITKSEVLASVPARHFADAVEKAVPNFRLKRAKDDPPSCRLDLTDHAFRFVFRIG